MQAAETITHAGLDTLDGLVAKSLLVRRQHAHTPSRLGMLETIRAYAAERFAGRRRRATPSASATTATSSRWPNATEPIERSGAPTRKEHLAQLDAETDNLHAALGWAVAQADAEQALAMCAALGRYWLMRDRYADAVEWIDQALSLPGADAHPALRVRALCTRPGPLAAGARSRATRGHGRG